MIGRFARPLRHGLLCVALACAALAGPASALDWITIAPNPAYTRDLSLGASTIALPYAPQSQSINPAGLSLFDVRSGLRGTVVLNPAGLYQVDNLNRAQARTRSGSERVADGLRLLSTAGVLQLHQLTVAALLSQPIMLRGDTARYADYEHGDALARHQNSLQVTLNLHPRVALGARIDRYYRYDVPDGEGYSYGVILQPKGVRVGVEYQQYPRDRPWVQHPLDRRADESTTAGVAWVRANYALTVQVMNLTQPSQPAYLEPHAGVEWRPVRALALRAGGMQFSRSRRWAWTAGIGLLDANWFRDRPNRYQAADDVLQLGVGVIYDRRVPVQGITSLTCAWRF